MLAIDTNLLIRLRAGPAIETLRSALRPASDATVSWAVEQGKAKGHFATAAAKNECYLSRRSLSRIRTIMSMIETALGVLVGVTGAGNDVSFEPGWVPYWQLWVRGIEEGLNPQARSNAITHTLVQSAPTLIFNYDVSGELLPIPWCLNSKAGAAGFLRS
jgi:hypothetical protein